MKQRKLILSSLSQDQKDQNLSSTLLRTIAQLHLVRRKLQIVFDKDYEWAKHCIHWELCQHKLVSSVAELTGVNSAISLPSLNPPSLSPCVRFPFLADSKAWTPSICHISRWHIADANLSLLRYSEETNQSIQEKTLDIVLMLVITELGLNKWRQYCECSYMV